MSPTAPPILNVDDTEPARYAKTRTLQHAGFSVVEARNGAEALALAESLRPALVLLDVKLPDISGIELCQVIKQRWPGTIVLQTSATFVTAGDRVRGLEGGADAYLIQPIDAGELVASVRAMLRLHAAEEATRRLNETLERRIEERTRELHLTNVRLVEQIAQRERAEVVLVQAQKMEAIGQLTGSMAHDFNNILASMVGYVHLARRKTGELEIQGLLDRALAASERGKRLTMRLLAFTRTDVLTTGPTDIRNVVAGMREWLEQTAGSAIRITFELADGELVALTDATQFELAVLNLVINARDAMPEGGTIAVTVARRTLVSADDELAAGEYVVVAVSDSGTGMAPDVAQQAFDPFFTTKPVGRGTGLGLAQVANVARLSRGAARIASATGQGTTVSIWMAVGDAAGLEQAQRVGDAVQLAGRGEQVLVVDDEHDIRRTLGQLLRDNGYVVNTADSGTGALEQMARAAPDIVVLDLALPGMSGIEVARRMRAQHADLPVVFMSGHAQRDQLQAAMPGVRLLRKPFRSDELFIELRRGLGDGRAPA